MDARMTVLTFSLASGLSLLVPVPFLDDMIEGYFQRRMVRELGAIHGWSLSKDEVGLLANNQGAGCASVLAGRFASFVFKRIAREIFFFAEWQRSIKELSHSYYYGYLLDHAFEQGRYTPGQVEKAARLRDAINTAHAHANSRLVNNVVENVFRHSKQIIRAAVDQIYQSQRELLHRKKQQAVDLMRGTVSKRRIPWITDWLLSRIPREYTEDEFNDQIRRDQLLETPEMQNLKKQIWSGIASLPESHFDDMRQRLAAEIQRSTSIS
jgi:hypothetical protein